MTGPKDLKLTCVFVSQIISFNGRHVSKSSGVKRPLEIVKEQEKPKKKPLIKSKPKPSLGKSTKSKKSTQKKLSDFF